MLKKKRKKEGEEEEKRTSLTRSPLFPSLFTRYPTILEEAEGFFYSVVRLSCLTRTQISRAIEGEKKWVTLDESQEGNELSVSRD